MNTFKNTASHALIRKVRICMIIVIGGLFISGVTAFPLQTELEWLSGYFDSNTTLGEWFHRVTGAIVSTNAQYPYLSYGTDWLAFAHIILAFAFIGPYLDPWKNKWMVFVGLVSCVAIFPMVAIAGQVRGIPWFWQLVDCSFGIVAFFPLIYAYRCISKLERAEKQTAAQSGLI